MESIRTQLSQEDEPEMKEMGRLSESLANTFAQNERKSDFDDGQFHRLQSRFNELESIIDFRVKELKSKIDVIEKFETQVERLTQVAKSLEEKLPEALEEGIDKHQPEVLMELRKKFDETVKEVKSVEDEIATDFANLNLSIPRLVTEEIMNNKSMFRHIHEQINQREESIGRNLK